MNKKKQLLIVYKAQDEDVFSHIKTLINTEDDVSDSEYTGVEDDTVLVMKCLTVKWAEMKEIDPADKYLFIDCNPGNRETNGLFTKFGVQYGYFDDKNFFVKLLPDYPWNREEYNLFLRELEAIVDKESIKQDALIRKEVREDFNSKTRNKISKVAGYIFAPASSLVILGLDKQSDNKDKALLRKQMLYYGITKMYLDDLDSLIKK